MSRHMPEIDMTQQLAGDVEVRARQMLTEISRELEAASHAARDAGATADRQVGWNGLQGLFARYDAAAELMRELRRLIDTAVPAPRD